MKTIATCSSAENYLKIIAAQIPPFVYLLLGALGILFLDIATQ
jgi:formate dehydrogenase maturation protein FdhE